MTEAQLALNMAVLAILISFGALAVGVQGHVAPPDDEPRISESSSKEEVQ